MTVLTFLDGSDRHRCIRIYGRDNDLLFIEFIEGDTVISTIRMRGKESDAVLKTWLPKGK